jgi:hypothetical protein
MGFTAGVLQFIVAAYALRLSRRFGTMRVGWSLFWAFLLLAVLHLTQSVMHGSGSTEFGLKVDAMDALISMLLLIGLVHLEAMLKERVRVEQEEKRLRAELESEIRKKTDYLMRALESLQAEMDERKRAESETVSMRDELTVASRRAEMAKLAATVLQSVGELLRSVNDSANLVSDQVKQSRISNVVNIGALIREHGTDLGTFMTRDPRGQKLPIYIAQLAQHLANEQSDLLTQLNSMKENLEKIRVMEQDFVKLSGDVDVPKVSVTAPEAPEVEDAA